MVLILLLTLFKIGFIKHRLLYCWSNTHTNMAANITVFPFATLKWSYLLSRVKLWNHYRYMLMAFLWSNGWEICFLASLFLKHQAYLPCITNQNKEDNRYGMIGLCPVVIYQNRRKIKRKCTGRIITLDYQKLLRPLGVQEVTSLLW